MQLYTSPVKLSNPQRFITINCIFLLFFHTLLLLSFIFFSVCFTIMATVFKLQAVEELSWEYFGPQRSGFFFHPDFCTWHQSRCSFAQYWILLHFCPSWAPVASWLHCLFSLMLKPFAPKTKQKQKKFKSFANGAGKMSRILAKAKGKFVKLRIFLWFLFTGLSVSVPLLECILKTSSNAFLKLIFRVSYSTRSFHSLDWSGSKLLKIISAKSSGQR